MNSIKMFKFIKQIFVSTMMFFNSLSSQNPLECVPMNNQECKVRPETVDVNLYFILLLLKQVNVVVIVTI